MTINLKNFMPGENVRMMAIAAFIGLMAGITIILFQTVVKGIEALLFEGGKELLGIHQGGWRLLLLPLIPMTGVALLIPLSLLFPGEVNGYGFTKFLRKVNLEGGYIRARTIFIKLIATALTIGSGNSAGVEGPIASIGGAIGSQVGQASRVSGTRMKVYIAAGCAGGVAGIFNAPLAGIFFCLRNCPARHLRDLIFFRFSNCIRYRHSGDQSLLWRKPGLLNPRLQSGQPLS